MGNLTKKEIHMMFQSSSYKDIFDAILCMEQDKYNDAPDYVRDAIYEAWMERFDTTGFLDMDVLRSIETDLGIDQTINWLPQQDRLFIDMDGTIAEFKPCKTMEKLYEKGYFLNLEPVESVIDGIRYFQDENPETEIYILSACLSDSKYAEQEKNEWLNMYVPEIDETHRIFPPCGEDKSLYIPNGIQAYDTLLDDYSVNLFQWQRAGGQAIKLMNGINGTKGKWQGKRIFANQNPKQIATTLQGYVKRKEVNRKVNLTR